MSNVDSGGGAGSNGMGSAVPAVCVEQATVMAAAKVVKIMAEAMLRNGYITGMVKVRNEYVSLGACSVVGQALGARRMQLSLK